ncbi:MAG: DUF1570 domain-containing protein [Planctomycetaceae bacterium]|nr:DUF1570 domain-containing protein [Planctomycetaceae bacterium]
MAVLVVAACLSGGWSAARVGALEHVTVRRDGGDQAVAGRVLVEAQDGGLLFQTRDGAIWIIQPEEVVDRGTDETPFEAWGPDAVAQQLLVEFPSGFKIHRTANYVICYNTSDVYAEWCGGLYERLYRGFCSYWRNRGLTLEKPEFPLVALVFNDKESYASYACRELGEASGSIFGYYSLETNRVTMYDLTGADGLRRGRRGGSSAAHINQVLSQPAAERTVATIVHEATHQLAYNTGLQTRFAGNPMWVSEGIAVYFETPDLDSARGWRNIGAVNRVHLQRFRKALSQRPADALPTLLTDDSRFRDPHTAPDAYAGAWALTYYLMRVRREQYVSYLQEMAQLRPLAELTAAERLAQFCRAFGDDLERLDRDFVRYMREVK